MDFEDLKQQKPMGKINENLLSVSKQVDDGRKKVSSVECSCTVKPAGAKRDQQVGEMGEQKPRRFPVRNATCRDRN